MYLLGGILGSGYFNVINSNSSLLLDVNGASKTNWAGIMQLTANPVADRGPIRRNSAH